MVYFNKHIICSSLISCIFFAKTSIIIADIIIDGETEYKTVIQPEINSKKPALATSIKISPMRTSNRINDELSKKKFSGNKKEHVKTDTENHKEQTDNKVTVIQKNKSKFIDGYKIDHNGKPSAYVYGHIKGDENGNIFGYLYENNASPVYFYGRSTNGDRKSIYAKDRQSGVYILYKQPKKDATVNNR